jgi:hypothetical protein
MYMCADTPAFSPLSFYLERIHDLKVSPSQRPSLATLATFCTLTYQLIYALYA